MNRRNLFLVFGLLFFFLGGVSLFGAPEFETTYSCQENFRSCPSKASCFVEYSLVVGNTGRRPQQEVQVYLRPGMLQLLSSPIKVKNRAARRDYEIREDEKATLIMLKNFQPEELVYVVMMVNPNQIEVEDYCNYSVQSVGASEGEVRVGIPDAVRFLRFLYLFFGMTLPPGIS